MLSSPSVWSGYDWRARLDLAIVPVGVTLAALLSLSSVAPLSLYALLAILFAAAAIRLPGVILACYIYLPYYKPAVPTLAFVDISVVLSLMCFLLFIVLTLRGELVDWKRAAESIFVWSLILIAIAIGTLYAADPEIAEYRLLNFVVMTYLPCLLAIPIAQNSALRGQVIWGTLCISAIVTVVGIVKLALLEPATRLSVFGVYPIGVGRAALMLPIVLLMIRRPKLSRVGSLLWVLVPFSVTIAFASGSRGPLLTAAVAVAVAGLRYESFRLKRAGVIALVGLAIIGTFQLSVVRDLVPRSSTERMTTLISSILGDKEDATSEIRLELFSVALEMFLTRPFWGSGTGAFESAVQGVPQLREFTYPHNLPLHFAAEYGLLGLLPLTYIAVMAIVRGYEHRTQNWVQVLLALTIFAFASSLLSNDFLDNRWLWSMLVLLIALPKHKMPNEHLSAASEHNQLG